MKKALIFFFILAAESSFGQFSMTPTIGINSTKLKLGQYYTNGGNYLTYGLETEYGFKPKNHRRVYGSLMTGASYLSNGFYDIYNFSFTGLNWYESKTTDLTTTYIQIPIVLKLNWQPLPLIEDWKLFFGLGISYDILLKSHLAESSTKVTESNDLFAPPKTTQHSDSQHVTDLGVKNPKFGRLELGMRYKRIMFSYRFSFSMQDMYYVGLEKIWKVPASESRYISAHETEGKIKEKYSEFVLGFRLF